MFFYRPWAGNEDKYPDSTVSNVNPWQLNQFEDARWGYAALLLLTLLAGLIMNGVFLGAFLYNWSNLKKLPHLACFMLSIRDLIVALILIPICVDW